MFSVSKSAVRQKLCEVGIIIGEVFTDKRVAKGENYEMSCMSV